jgi:hypothetical protein
VKFRLIEMGRSWSLARLSVRMCGLY